MRTAILLATLISVASCDGPPPIEHASSDFPTGVEGREVILTYQGTHDVVADEDPDVELLVVVHHDGRTNSVSSFDDMMAALEAAALDRPELRLREITMVLSPAMISEWHLSDDPDRYGSGHYPWWGGGWRGGDVSENAPAVSNFELIDALILHVAERFPGLRAVVQIGHSAGGQLVSRYAVGTTVHDQLRERGIYMRSIIANPSSFLYFDRQRPNLAAGTGLVDYGDRVPSIEGQPCPDFNEYLYGMDGLNEYMRRRSVPEMLAAFESRDIWLFNGMEDNDPTARDMDASCPAVLQGPHRLQRGRNYYEYLGHFFGSDIYDSKFIESVPGVGHSGRGLFASDQGKAIIFIDADSLAGRGFSRPPAGRAPHAPPPPSTRTPDRGR